ncbi:hypothetical protein Tco_1415419 [Tanacetum coccineum]
MKKEKINITPIIYSELNKLAEDFEKHFVPQQGLSTKQKFWLQSSDKNSEEPNTSNTPVKIEKIVKSARALSPLDSNLDLACRYVQRIQEVLAYIRDTCPYLTRPGEKLVVVTPKNKDKKVRFADPVTSSSNTQKQVDSHKPKDSNQPLLHSTGVIGSTDASGSKPTRNTKNNRISQSSSSNKTNKVEDQ